ncbi:AAA domain-containing protein [Steroidobacter cummioxidans]|uniref:AAA domain-containing protein n=1 Tax=Steroidobacter cummioxidans TaxID=1803913 RepID=UPI000E315ECC
MIRLCPNCRTERALTELFCLGEFESAPCSWDLTSTPISEPGRGHEPQTPVGAVCTNGHPMAVGDFLCAQCGADVATAISERPATAETSADIGGWRRVRELPSSDKVRERFIVARVTDGYQAEMSLYSVGSEPDPAVYEVLRRLPRDYVPEILQTGRWEGRAFEVTEELTGGTLADLGLLPEDETTLSRIVSEIGAALHSFAERGLRHRDLRPGAIVVRTRDPLDLVITDFGSARLSEFDLDIVSPLETTRYTSPEGIAGGVAAASDWWSLGIVLLEQVTRGACFEGVNDQAFLIHVLTNGAPIPDNIDPRLQLLLRGLLARDRRERWGWAEITRWLAGDSPPAPRSSLPPGATDQAGRGIKLAGRTHTTGTSFALAAADGATWDEAKDLLLRGAIVTWAQEMNLDATATAWLRDIARVEGLSDDFRLALALKQLNPAIPLICRGEIVTPGWLLDHLAEGHALICGPVPDLLQRMDAEPWLTRLKVRAAAVRERASQFEIDLNEDDVRVHVLSTSRSRLAALWAERRVLLPDTDHPALAAIIERRQANEEDLILLLSAAVGHFRTPDDVLNDAATQAMRAGLEAFDRNAALAHLQRPRAEIYQLLENRISGFVRSGIERLDEWADQFRLERRLSLARILVVLSIPQNAWQEPPGQQYVATLLDFFARRLATAVQRGPLSRMVIGKTTARIDLTELDTPRVPAAALLDRILVRGEQLFDVDPAAFADSTLLERRVRTLHSHSTLYRRDTGIDGLYLGFPFLLMQDTRASVRPRIAPVLLWPLKLKPEVGASGRVSLGFDRDREEVRLNPALDALLGPDAVRQWQTLAHDLLHRQSLTAAELMDAFSTLMPAQGRALAPLPGKDTRVKNGQGQLTCSAVVFHLSYAGQAIMEDLRQLKTVPPTATALATALRLAESLPTEPIDPVPESERFFTADRDPSQEAAVFEARRAPGLVVEGPPGTGKSQTIVNMIADAIGRDRSVLVVCQKQPALEVVRKRLAAEGFGNRLMMITDVNADRERVVRAVREQLESIRATAPAVEQAKRTRTQLVSRLQSLKSDLDKYHHALHAVDPQTDLSYRVLLGDLLNLERSTPPPIDAPQLRQLLAGLDVTSLIELEDACSPLARHWLPARYEGSALAALSSFGSDAGTLKAFQASFEAFTQAELERDSVVDRTGTALRVNDARSANTWLDTHGPVFRNLDAPARERVARWLPFFAADESPEGAKLQTELAEILQQFAGIHHATSDPARVPLTRTRDETLHTLHSAAQQLAQAPESFLESLSPIRWMNGRRLRSFFTRNKIAEVAPDQLLTAVTHEQELRAPRARLGQIAARLHPGGPGIDELPKAALEQLATDLRAQLAHAQQLASHVATSPHPLETTEALRAATVDAFDSFSMRVRQGCERHTARTRSLAALASIDSYLTEDWRISRKRLIESDQSNRDVITPITAAMPTLPAYQRFRMQAQQLPERMSAAFECLRIHEAVLDLVPKEDMEAVVRHTLAREARLAWKARIESTYPVLLSERSELDAKRRSLKDIDVKLRGANRNLLVDGIDLGRIGSVRDWEDITRLRGQRARRLREFLSRGVDLGLTALRPVWLMNPDVASRVLPLKPGLFDTVIFDEASQMPVEFAVPALYRSRIVVVSGDEKQMPPTAFFAGRVDDDDEFTDGETADDAGDDDSAAAMLVWNRREIKDCPDLLQLAKSALPTTTLKIHYRSAFRELIAFSNASFYGNHLNIPVRHPDDKVRRERPIQVLRADGVYSDQTNPAEADLVIDVLAQLWAAPVDRRVSSGVVTFNRKQADLIEEKLEERAEANAAFRDALTLERERVVDDQDMRFFVKNVENVQGDERDVIVFSSTFGRNPQGTFRRNFGVLGQTGGERRLNVAVTRARKRVVLVTSMPVAEVSDLLTTQRAPSSARDFLQAYLEYARATSAGEFDSSRALLSRIAVAHNESVGRQRGGELDGFIRTVIEFVHSLGFRALALRDTSVFGIDLVVENPRTGLYGLGIECDAPRHPLLEDAWAREVWRPALLGNTISRVHRVSSNGWYVDRALEQSQLRQALQEALG